ncbi:hypothetical protein [Streptomyces albus]|uniref:hypothetical protein n=1 Tax=Streptomyces albus TaxID=1888 RepID=UPI0024E0E5F8|nr:hypothetical protein [Streptomyces albus]GHJ18881.1 hypothetical protein TPA0909_04950 [Streptomyces albus]
MSKSGNSEFDNSVFERAWEPPEEVVLRRELVRTPGLQPEDVGVLSELLLRDPRLPSTMEAIRKDLQMRLGWKMGKDRYKAIAARLTRAGHMARIPAYDSATQRPTWVTRVYRNPANNEQYVDLGITASMQVGAEVRETRDPADGQPSESRETRVSAGQGRSAGNPRSGAEVRETRDPADDVFAGQGRKAGNPQLGAPPPHPPEGEDSSSPYPLTAPGGVLPSQREEEGFTQEETAAAARFLQQMKRWQAGAATARKCAPRLLRAMRAQGWPALAALDEEHLGLLEAEILKNTGGAVSWSRCLPGWVDDLRLYERVKPRPRREQQQTADVCRKPGHGGGAFLADDCGECRAEAGRVAREGASRVDTAALIGLLHSKRRGPTP